MRDIMLVVMIRDMPFPIPRSWICSPSHMMNTVPAVRVSTVVKVNNNPGAGTIEMLSKLPGLDSQNDKNVP